VVSVPVAPVLVVPVAGDGAVVSGAGAVAPAAGAGVVSVPVADGAAVPVPLVLFVAGVDAVPELPVPVFVSMLPAPDVVPVLLVPDDVPVLMLPLPEDEPVLAAPAPPLMESRSLGIRTVSMAWIIPLLAMMSACVTVASLILTVPPLAVTCSVLPSRVGGEVGEVMEVAVAALMLAGMTWYFSTAASLVGSFSRFLSAPLGSFLNAALVGANTVNGPAPCRAETRSARLSSRTRVEKRLSLMAVATMSIVGAIGMVDDEDMGGVVDVPDDIGIVPVEPAMGMEDISPFKAIEPVASKAVS